MMNVQIIAVGKLKESYLREAAAEYQKRLAAYCTFKITEIPEEKLPDNPRPADIVRGLEREGRRILERIGKGAYVAALCIEGKQISSEGLAGLIADAGTGGVSGMDFIIGGSFGLSDEVKNRADMRLSMSAMTFPHQLARVMLCEQIYRAFSIMNGGKYHK